MKITPVILSGGSGTRLWPVSRSLNPKQFLNFFGKYSLFQDALLRVKDKKLFHNPIAVCNEEHRFIVAEEMQKIKSSPSSILLEPASRNTAPAIAAAAFDVIEKNKKDDDIILVMPSDHIIKDEKKFISALKDASAAAMDGYLITFGIEADKPETGYGYIQKGKALNKKNKIFAVEKFIEKPQKSVAEKLIKSKNYFWNSGIFMFKASAYLENLQKFEKEIFTLCKKSYDKSLQDLDFLRLEKDSFSKCKNISIDYAVMEKAEKVAVMPLNIGWSDIGNWGAISEISKKDKNQNTILGEAMVLDTKGSYINSQNGLVATIGVENLIIISLKDAVLVANKDNAQDVKTIVEMLKKQQREECNSHKKVLRPWGSFETVDFSDRFKVKRITVNPKASLSLQMHNHRAEHWVVVKGQAHVTCGSKEFVLNEDESTYISMKQKHRLENKTNSPLEIIEIQTGKYLGEDDIVRFQDIYGR